MPMRTLYLVLAVWNLSGAFASPAPPGVVIDHSPAKSKQYIGSPTQGDGTTYPAGSFPRYSPVSGIGGAAPQQLGCCEQLDQDSFAIILAWQTGLTDSSTYAKIRTTANHIQGAGPDTTERWEDFPVLHKRERITPLSREETKWRVTRGLVHFCCAQMRKIDDGARRERSDVEGQREALTSGQRINQSHLRRP